MKHIESNPFRLKAFFEELLLYSGQFGLFYIVMQMIIKKAGFFTNIGHVVLLCALLAQALFFAILGENGLCRISGSFLVPVIYSAFEFAEGQSDVLNAAHIGFWIYACSSSLLMLVKIKGRDRLSRASESLLVVQNILIFIFLYFYFDTWKDVQSSASLTILVIFGYLPAFLSDPTHWFIIIGGALLALTVALGRNEVATLKDRIVALFGKYVDGNVRDRIIKEGQFQARKQRLCILFSDIISFTSLCESNDPGSITKMLNIYFEYWNSKVKKFNGTIDKYIGDAIMVIFGLDEEKDACDSAVMCAVEMHDERMNLERELRAAGLPVPKGYGIGLHFGELIVGDIGSLDRKNFTVIGDTVNIASRLESATRTVESRIVISSEVYERLDEDNKGRFASIGVLGLKGKEEGIAAWGIAERD